MNRRSLNNKGMTLVELIISVALLSIVMTFLFKIIIDVKYEKDNSGFAEANQVNRAEFIRTVQNDLLDKKFESLIDGAADNKKLIISYRDKSTGEITVLDDVITYLVRDKDGNTKINSWELKDNDYKFGDINTETLASCYVKINILVERALDNSSIDDIEILAKYYSCPYTDPNYLNETVIRKQGGRNNAGVLTNVDFNYPSTDDDTGLYKASDDYGTSYYLRGNIIDNYVKFGKNSAGQDLYWRIIRINGNGTIRLFYHGLTLKPNMQLTKEEFDSMAIGKTKYNSYHNDVKYVGYTYDDGTGNQTSSLIKKVIDDWYEDNLLDNYNIYLADAIFCNDREKRDSDGDYVSHYRIMADDPTLICNNKEDRYTVKDTVYGNGYLKYPIATLTADEAIMAGSSTQSIANYNFYLTNSGFVTMTPAYSKLGAALWILARSGNTSFNNMLSNGTHVRYFADYNFNVQPVINLKANVKVSAGDGTIDSPYEITF